MVAVEQSLFQRLFEALIVIGVLGSIGLGYYARFKKISFGQAFKKLMSFKWRKDEEVQPIINKREEISRWREQRPIM